MKELPISEQPLEKFEKYGVGVLSDAELLAVILRCGGKETTALELSHQILSKKEGNLLNLHALTLEEMMEIPGIGRVKAMQLKCITELCRRMSELTYRRRIQILEPKTLADYYMERLRHEERECLLVVLFDTKSRVLGDALLTVGTVNSSLISPREIFLKALQYKAVQIIILHNHPSGDPSPSKEDLSVTQRISQCGELLGILLIDHIIIGDGNFCSLRESGWMNRKGTEH